MKKIININFHSRVVPIEETAYEILQQYVESLRKYFANEEGRDEIVNDIENRFAELFSECLKKGGTCIADADVNTIITSMGRPEDFEQDEMAGPSIAGSSAGNAGSGRTSNSGSGQGGAYQQQGASSYAAEEPRRLYRAENDKILGGVCAGLANYLRLGSGHRTDHLCPDHPGRVRTWFYPVYHIMGCASPKIPGSQCTQTLVSATPMIG